MSDSCDPMDCSPADCSVHGISQARILAWVAISFSRGSSRSRDHPGLLHCRWILYQLSHQGSHIARRPVHKCMCDEQCLYTFFKWILWHDSDPWSQSHSSVVMPDLGDITEQGTQTKSDHHIEWSRWTKICLRALVGQVRGILGLPGLGAG